MQVNLLNRPTTCSCKSCKLRPSKIHESQIKLPKPTSLYECGLFTTYPPPSPCWGNVFIVVLGPNPHYIFVHSSHPPHFNAREAASDNNQTGERPAGWLPRWFHFPLLSFETCEFPCRIMHSHMFGECEGFGILSWVSLLFSILSPPLKTHKIEADIFGKG